MGARTSLTNSRTKETRGPKKLAENAAQAGEAAGQQSKV